jgi:hypothetical protein
MMKNHGTQTIRIVTELKKNMVAGIETGSKDFLSLYLSSTVQKGILCFKSVFTFSSSKIKENKMSMECNMHGKDEKSIQKLS